MPCQPSDAAGRRRRARGLVSGQPRGGGRRLHLGRAVLSPTGKWSETRRISPEDGLPHWNPVLFRRADGEILLFYKRGRTIAYWQTMVMKSADEGKSWTEPRELVPGDEGGRSRCCNKILRLSDGSLLAPASIEQGEWRCFMDRSEDEGETWTRTADIRLPEPGGRAPQPLRRNSAVALGGRSGRSCAAAHLAGYLYRTDSENLGRSWSQPASSGIPNNKQQALIW